MDQMMDGYLLLADGTRLDGRLVGAARRATGWVVANTAVVGFQEMATDPVYKDALLAFTYPEIGSVGAAEAFGESPRVQVGGLIVKVLSAYRSHYLAEEDLADLLARAEVPCLTDVDTRGLAVHLREHGEMAAAIAPAGQDAEALLAGLAETNRPQFVPSEACAVPEAADGPKVAVLNLGVRRSDLAQLALCCRPVLLPYDADAEAVQAEQPSGIIVSDGPGDVLPPAATVRLLGSLAGQMPILGLGLGHVALGMALGCEPAFLTRGHHGANYPVKGVGCDGVAVTCQRHTVMLDGQSLCDSPRAELLWENMNDGTVEGIASADGTAVGLQFMPVPAQAGEVSPHVRRFVDQLG